MTSAARVPRVVYVLAAGTVMLGTTELMITGPPPQIAAGPHVVFAQAGLLITASPSA
jgi:predicted MFS family arabinose efflux permease